MMDGDNCVKVRRYFDRVEETLINKVTEIEEKIAFDVCKQLKTGTNVQCGNKYKVCAKGSNTTLQRHIVNHHFFGRCCKAVSCYSEDKS